MCFLPRVGGGLPILIGARWYSSIEAAGNREDGRAKVVEGSKVGKMGEVDDQGILKSVVLQEINQSSKKKPQNNWKNTHESRENIPNRT